MFFPFKPTAIGPGLFPTDFRSVMTNATGATMAIGDIVAANLGASGVTVVDPGGTVGTSIYSTVIAPTAAHIFHGYLGVITVAAVATAEAEVMWIGLTDFAFVIDAAASVAIGDPLIATTAKNLDGGTQAVNTKIIAHSRQVFTTPTTRTLGKVDFNGITGFGMNGGT